MKILYIIRGAQGSGKSTLAMAMRDAGMIDDYRETDFYFIKDGEYKWIPKLVGMNHKMCQDSCEELMKEGLKLAVSNTFTTRKEMKPYYDLAKRYGYMVQEIILKFPLFDNEHNVESDIVCNFSARLQQSLQQDSWWWEDDDCSSKLTPVG